MFAGNCLILNSDYAYFVTVFTQVSKIKKISGGLITKPNNFNNEPIKYLVSNPFFEQ